MLRAYAYSSLHKADLAFVLLWPFAQVLRDSFLKNSFPCFFLFLCQDGICYTNICLYEIIILISSQKVKKISSFFTIFSSKKHQIWLPIQISLFYRKRKKIPNSMRILRAIGAYFLRTLMRRSAFSWVISPFATCWLISLTCCS